MESFLSLWQYEGTFTTVEIVAIGLFLFSMNAVILWVNWVIQRYAILEYGYPKVKQKTLKKRLKSHSLFEHVMLTRICRESKRKGLYIYLCWFLNFLNCIAAILTAVGLVGAMITGGDGWAMTLLCFPPLSIMLFGALLKFVPDLICLPSERRRYFGRKK